MLIRLFAHQVLPLFYAINYEKGFVIAHMPTEPNQAYATHSDVRCALYKMLLSSHPNCFVMSCTICKKTHHYVSSG